MNKQETIKEIKEEIPETMKKGLIRKVKNTDREDFDLEEAMQDICNNQVEFVNHFTNNDRFREKFSEMMFDLVTE